ncbi:hypothetical protein WDH52_09605 [Streptomyces sp. TRM70308]|uniref:hypothetical protein n=1 Tax=Streptomyces sp. TRM70308 TaxID=3131932 RepID=UPI003CFFC1E2
MALRRVVAATTAVVLVLEGLGVAAVHWVLSLFLAGQSMSLDGLDPGLLVAVARGAGLALGACFVLCGALALRVAWRDRVPGRPTRLALAGCAVLHGIVGALAVALLGWPVFALLMAALALVVLTLVTYGPAPAAAPGPPGPAPA